MGAESSASQKAAPKTAEKASCKQLSKKEEVPDLNAMTVAQLKDLAKADYRNFHYEEADLIAACKPNTNI